MDLQEIARPCEPIWGYQTLSRLEGAEMTPNCSVSDVLPGRDDVYENNGQDTEGCPGKAKRMLSHGA